MIRVAIGFAPYLPDSSRMFGTRVAVSPVCHLIGTAGGWGGLPEAEAFYLPVEPNLPEGEYKIEVPAEVPVGAFWSVSVYNAERYFVPNALDAYVVNSVMGARNADGSMTVHFGDCEDGWVNCLPLMKGWNYLAVCFSGGRREQDPIYAFEAHLYTGLGPVYGVPWM